MPFTVARDDDGGFHAGGEGQPRRQGWRGKGFRRDAQAMKGRCRLTLLVRAGIEHGLMAVSDKSSPLANFSWLLAGRGWRALLGLGVNIMVARHLGPGDFGLLSYALGFSAIFYALGGLGIDDVLARELVRHRARAPALLAAGLRLKFFGAMLAFGCLLFAAWWWRMGDTGAWTLVALAGAGLWFLPLDAIDVWFLAKEKLRPPVLARQGALAGAALLRLVLVWAGAPVWVFALAVMAEALLVAGALVWVLVRDEGWPDWKVVAPVSNRQLLSEGWPLLVSGVLVVVAMQADRLLLLRLAGEVVAGVYAAAARFTELLHALPLALGAVLLPRLTALRQADLGQYWRTARHATGLLLLASVLLAAGLSLGGLWLLPGLLGEKYRAAGGVLAVHAWSLVFISIVSLRSRLLVIEGHSRWVLVMALGTAVLNVLGNLWLIPSWGALGAAWSAVGAWGISALALPWFWPGSRAFMRQWCGLAKSDDF